MAEFSICSAPDFEFVEEKIDRRWVKIDCLEVGLVFAAATLNLDKYLSDIEPFLEALALDEMQRKAIQMLHSPFECALCVCAECVGDDVALRTFVLGTRAWISLEAITGLPPFSPKDYRWTHGDLRTSLASPPVVTRTEPLRVAFVSTKLSSVLGGGPLGFDAMNRYHMMNIFEEVFPKALWRLRFREIKQLDAVDELFEQWWNQLPALIGWFFAWSADALLIDSKSPKVDDWVAQEYDVLVFLTDVEEVEFMPYKRGRGPVRLLMPIEPYIVLNWIVGEIPNIEPEALRSLPGMLQVPSPGRRVRAKAFLTRHGVCPVVLDLYDLTWVTEHQAYLSVEDRLFDRRFTVREGRELPADAGQLAPLFLAPAVGSRPRLPLYRPWRHAVTVQLELLRDSGERGTVMLSQDSKFGPSPADMEWATKELKHRGFAVLSKRLLQRGLDVFTQPRAVARTLQENYVPELAASKYVILVSRKPSAGQILAEAALLGLLAISSPEKYLTRLLYPPELHASTMVEALARVDELEARPTRAMLLRAVVRARAERILGADAAPPMRLYLELLSSAGIPSGQPSLPLRTLCAPPNTSVSPPPGNSVTGARLGTRFSAGLGGATPGAVGFWLLAAGRECGQGSTPIGSAPARAASPRACAARCHTAGGRIFSLDSATRTCRPFRSCKLVPAAPTRWDTDVFALHGADTGEAGEGGGLRPHTPAAPALIL